MGKSSFRQRTAEHFEAATVCFTEIDRFREIAKECSPLEVVVAG